MADRIFEILGRRLRLGVIGGGKSSLIGPAHRIAARLDDDFEIVAGVLSSDAERSLADARSLGIARGYPDAARMLAEEAARPDGMDAVAIMTPNDSHFRLVKQALEAGLDVICDKPITNELSSARELASLARVRERTLCLTHNYSGYPMVREAKAAIAAGEIGPPRIASVHYLSGSLGTRVEDRPDDLPDRTKWRLDVSRGGVSGVLNDIGTHAHHLLTFVTGARVEAVLADVGAALPERTAHDTAAAILRLESGIRGAFFATKAATGAENAVAFEVYGEGGGLSWSQAAPNELKVMRQARPIETRTRGLPTNHPYARRAARLPPGHPEAFFEAFANIYADFAQLVAARLSGREPDPLATMVPQADDGVDGLAFVDACLASTASGTWASIARPERPPRATW